MRALIVVVVVGVIVGGFAANALKAKRAFRVECGSGVDGGIPKEQAVPMDGGTVGSPVYGDALEVIALPDAGYTSCIKVNIPAKPDGTNAATNAAKNLGSEIGPPSAHCAQGTSVFIEGTDGRCESLGAKQQVNIILYAN